MHDVKLCRLNGANCHGCSMRNGGPINERRGNCAAEPWLHSSAETARERSHFLTPPRTDWEALSSRSFLHQLTTTSTTNHPRSFYLTLLRIVPSLQARHRQLGLIRVVAIHSFCNIVIYSPSFAWLTPHSFPNVSDASMRHTTAHLVTSKLIRFSPDLFPAS